MLFVGDDWAEDHHDVELMDAAGRMLAKARLAEGVAKIARLHALIGAQLGDDVEDVTGQVSIEIETDSGSVGAGVDRRRLHSVRGQPVAGGRYRDSPGDVARRFFRQALTALKVIPTEMVTDAAPVYPRVLDELVPAAWHHVERYANNRIEADHSRLKHRLRPVRRLRTDRTAQVIITGLAFLQNLRRGHHELATETPRPLRIAAAFSELAAAI